MVLKRDNKIIIDCACNKIGCGNTYVFTKDENEVFISTLTENYYSRTVFFAIGHKIENIKSLLNKKNKHKVLYENEIIVSPKDIIELINALEVFVYDIVPGNETKDVENKATLNLNYDPVCKIYTLRMRCPDIGIKTILKDEEYKYFNTTYTKDEILQFCRRAKNYLIKHGDL